MHKIPIYRPYLYGNEKDYVNQCLDSTWISSKGEFIDKFEAEFSNYVGVEYATSVCNGTVAIHLAIEALGLKVGDEIIVPTLTYVASVNTIVHAGAIPVFVDSLDDTWNMNPADVILKITKKTKAVMAVHLYGLPCDMDVLRAICREHNLYLIEDAAEAFGTYYKGQHVGTFGDIATFSFFGNKTITTGEGGMVVTNNKALFDKAYHLKTQGVSPTKTYWHDCIAYNYRMTNICAAIGLAQLENANLIIEKKRKVAEWYREGLKNLPLKTHDELPDTKHSFWMCSIVVNDAAQRNPLRDNLKAAGIETRPLFYPAHTMPHYAANQSFPIAESLGARGINLPSFPDLTRQEVDAICDVIRLYFQ
jgi:perosamine synthetase